jgi:hypothetical protein
MALKIKSVLFVCALVVFKVFSFLVVQKIITEVLTCFYENTSEKILKVITEMLFKELVAAFRKSPVTLILVPKPACGPEMSYRKPPRTFTFTRIFPASIESWTPKSTNDEREAGTEIMIRLREQFLELVSDYKEASRNFILIFLWKKAG